MHIGDTDTSIDIPDALRATVARWRSGHRPEPPRWDRAAWRRRFPRQTDLVDALPDRVCLADAVRATDAGLAHGDPDSAERAFVAAMIWGYANSGYGPHRSGKVLDDGPHVAARLAGIARVAATSGAVAAVGELGDRPLRHLGVAFGTRFVRVCAPEVAVAPVLDSAVCRWFADHCGVRLRVDRWRPDEYRAFAETVAGWATRLGLATTVVEQLIVRAASDREGVPGPARIARVARAAGLNRAEPVVDPGDAQRSAAAPSRIVTGPSPTWGDNGSGHGSGHLPDPSTAPALGWVPGSRVGRRWSPDLARPVAPILDGCGSRRPREDAPVVEIEWPR